jgi:hypothetical protein
MFYLPALRPGAGVGLGLGLGGAERRRREPRAGADCAFWRNEANFARLSTISAAAVERRGASRD